MGSQAFATPNGHMSHEQRHHQQQQQQQQQLYTPTSPNDAEPSYTHQPANAYTPHPPTYPATAPYTPNNPNKPHTPDSRPKLDDFERKTRHSNSENKRRNFIREKFNRLAESVPGYEGHGKAEANVLEGAVNEIRQQMVLKAILLQMARGKGFVSTEHEFEGWWEDAGREEMEAYGEEGTGQLDGLGIGEDGEGAMVKDEVEAEGGYQR